MLRSRSRYEDLGEKPTYYVFKLENKNYTSKVISRLVDNEGNEYKNTKEILNCQKNFYTNLYFTHNVVDDEPLESKIGVNSNKLENKEAEKLEGEILYTELGKTLKTMKNNKIPGLDGFTVEFFIFHFFFFFFFLIDIGHFVHRSVNYAYRTWSLSVTQKQGIITCLPKPNKSRLD